MNSRVASLFSTLIFDTNALVGPLWHHCITLSTSSSEPSTSNSTSPFLRFLTNPSRRSLLAKRAAPLDESYEYAMDLELWSWLASAHVRWKVIDDVLGIFRNNGLNKTSTGSLAVTCEFERIYRQYCPDSISLTLWHRRLRFPLERLRNRHPGRACSALVRPIQMALAAALGPFYGLDRVRAMNWGAWT